jgi:hypothetical protein
MKKGVHYFKEKFDLGILELQPTLGLAARRGISSASAQPTVSLKVLKNLTGTK